MPLYICISIHAFIYMHIGHISLYIYASIYLVLYNAYRAYKQNEHSGYQAFMLDNQNVHFACP